MWCISKIFTILTLTLPLSVIFYNHTEARLGETYNRVYKTPSIQINNPTQNCSILAFSGGGSFGAVEIGILDDLLEKQKVPTHYDVLTGISAGGLNAGFLSYYRNIRDGIPEIQSIYKNLKNEDIYTRDILKFPTSWSIYNTDPLKKTLGNIIQKKVAEPGSPITIVGASNVMEERLDVFRYDELDITEKVDVLMATSAIPFVFPPYQINDTYYVDGGVITNEMIFEALGVLDCQYSNFLFISASSHDTRQKPITGLFSYTSAILHLLYSTFDYQIAEFVSQECASPRGLLKACFPNSTELEQYSILDFGNGEELLRLGKSNYYCANIDLC